MRNLSLLALTTALASSLGTPAAAQDRTHTPQSDEIIVTAPFARDRDDVLSGTSVLTGTELTRDLRTTIGETLTRQPGVSATSFGPNASRPVLRGFQGERVRVLRDGIGSIDVSNTSVDHAVVINPLTSERIEVLRGPAALLFGSSAIGGVVNVIDARIPRRVPDEVVHLDGIATYGSAAEERSGLGQIDLPVAGKVVFHLDGSYAKTNDLRIGGAVLAEPLRAQALASPDAAIRDLANLRDRLPNSAARTWEVAGGAALVTDGGNIGASFSHYDSLYGVPVRYSLDPDVEAERVRLRVKQDRADLRAEVPTGGGLLETIRLRAGFADYRHNEIEEDGSVATTFLNKSIESRLELVQATRGGWRGAVGGQLLIRDFNAIGDEAFVPKNTTEAYGVFTLQTFEFGAFRGEAGARFEHARLTADASETIGNPAYSRRFDAVSGSIGASYQLADGIRIGLSGSHAERAPAAEELFANGPHAGTQAFEIGNPDFRVERSNGIEATLRGTRGGFSFGIAAYASWFDNYIYEQATGEVEDGLPVFQYLQARARYLGIEGEASVRLARVGAFAINVDGVADYTHARVTDVGPVPRIPPFRVLGGIEAQSPRLDARVEVERVARQTRVAEFETATPGFTTVNASLSFKPFGGDNPTTLLISANNLFDVEARRHASFLKDYAPLAGRDIRITLRAAL